jgi:hypothetical protein
MLIVMTLVKDLLSDLKKDRTGESRVVTFFHRLQARHS